MLKQMSVAFLLVLAACGQPSRTFDFTTDDFPRLMALPGEIQQGETLLWKLVPLPAPDDNFALVFPVDDTGKHVPHNLPQPRIFFEVAKVSEAVTGCSIKKAGFAPKGFLSASQTVWLVPTVCPQ